MPARKHRIHPEARQDVAEGRDWYADHSVLAAERFLDEVDRAVDLIREAPERWPPFPSGMRRYVMTSFPYSVIYQVSADFIDIYAVALTPNDAPHIGGIADSPSVTVGGPDNFWRPPVDRKRGHFFEAVGDHALVRSRSVTRARGAREPLPSATCPGKVLLDGPSQRMS